MKFPTFGGGSGGGGGGGKVFIKMKDGDKIRGIFRGDPHIFRQHWVSGKSVICPGQDECEHCGGGDKAKFRFRLNFLTKEDGVWVAKIFEQGYGAYKDLKELHEGDYNLEETYVQVSRLGEGTDTEYKVIPVKDNGGLKPRDFADAAKVPLNELKPKDAAPAAPESPEDVPF